MTLDTSDRKSIREAEKRAKLSERNRGEVTVAIMSTVPGREWLWNFLDSLNVFGSPVGGDSHATYFLLGEQNAGKRLMADAMQFCPDLFIQAMREANGRRTERDTIDTNALAERSGEQDPGRDDQGRGGSGPEVDDTGQVHYDP